MNERRQDAPEPVGPRGFSAKVVGTGEPGPVRVEFDGPELIPGTEVRVLVGEAEPFCLGRLMVGQKEADEYEGDYCDQYDSSEGPRCEGRCAYTDAFREAWVKFNSPTPDTEIERERRAWALAAMEQAMEEHPSTLVHSEDGRYTWPERWAKLRTILASQGESDDVHS